MIVLGIFTLILLFLYITYFKQRQKKLKEIEEVLEKLNNNLDKNWTTKNNILSKLLHLKPKSEWDTANMVNISALKAIEEYQKEGKVDTVKNIFKLIKQFYL